MNAANGSAIFSESDFFSGRGGVMSEIFSEEGPNGRGIQPATDRAYLRKMIS
jgi:hypothetical protein